MSVPGMEGAPPPPPGRNRGGWQFCFANDENFSDDMINKEKISNKKDPVKGKLLTRTSADIASALTCQYVDCSKC